MELQWFGNNCFVVKGSAATVLIDPYTDVLKKLPSEVDIVVRTNGDDAKFSAEGIEYKHLFDWPGEFEAGGVAVTVVPVDKFSADANLVHLIVDEFRIGNLGYMSTELNDELTEAMGDLDVLMVPVGGGDVYKAKQANGAVETIEPKLVIPSCYGGDYADIAEFAKETGVKLDEADKKLKLKSPGALPVDKTDFALIEQS